MDNSYEGKIMVEEKFIWETFDDINIIDEFDLTKEERKEIKKIFEEIEME